MADLERETFDITIRVRVTPRLHDAMLSVIGPTSTVSDYVRRLLEAAVNVPEATPQFVPQTSERGCDIT